LKQKTPQNNRTKQKVRTNQIAGSFRDPAGFVFKDDKGEVFRQINPVGFDDFQFASQNGLYQWLWTQELLIKHTVVKKSKDKIIIEPQQVSTISYPFEWSFSMLKDAALLTLRAQKAALSHNMTLKDASAYNVQFVSGKPMLIDTLSFEKYQSGSPWVAYGQFCRHFLAPLALMSKTDIRLSQLLIEYIDGVPLDLASSLLPKSTKLSPSLLMHLHLHASAQKKKSDSTAKSDRKVSKTRLLAIIDSLERAITQLKIKKTKTEWGDYYQNTNYSNTSTQSKTKLIKSFAKKVPNLEKVVDLGGNDGTYSRIFSKQKIDTICTDIDPLAVEVNYQTSIEQADNHMLPLVINLINPGGAMGWANAERESIEKRFRGDLVLALALIHHLAISNNLPLSKIAEYFSKFGPYLIIEFVPKSDSKVKKLLATRRDIFEGYTQEGFEDSFQKYYSVVESKSIPGSKRTLYLLKRK